MKHPDRALPEAPTEFLSEPIEAYLAPLIEDLVAYETRARIPSALSRAIGDRYMIERELGRGGMATVYLALEKAPVRPVAIKVLVEPLAGALSKERFAREVELTTALQHERIVPVYDRGSAEGLHYYTMRYFPDGSLRERILREGTLSISSAIAIAWDVSAGLDFAHARGIVHRDIKPENILLDGDRAFIADFGVARMVDAAGRERLTETGAVLGTAHYMSPEQAGSESSMDGRSDVYSLGCVVFEMLAGDPPFTSSSPKTVIARHMHERPPRLSIVRPTVTLELEQAIERALAKQSADRYPTAGAFVEALTRALTGATARGRRLRRYGAGIGAAAIAGLVGAGVLQSVDGRESATSSARQVAVLYFDDLTSDGALQHVATGLTEDLIDELSQVRGLRVVSANGTKILRDSSLSPEQLAERFGIGTLITGSVTSSPSLLRLTVRLVDARSGTQINHDAWERPPWDLLTLQDSLTTEVALWLRERLGATVRPREQLRATRSVEAWELVQRGEALLTEGSALVRRSDPAAGSVLLAADSAFSAAEQHDRRWAAPAVGRARAALALAFSERDQRSSPKLDSSFTRALLRTVALASQALERNPGAAEALAVRGEARLRLAVFGVGTDYSVKLGAAEEDLRSAVTARPDLAEAWSLLGEVYYRKARFVEAADAQATAYRADAFIGNVRALISGLFLSNLYSERFDEARRWCLMGAERYSDDPRFAECELTLLGGTGRRRVDATTAWQLVSRIEAGDTAGLLSATWSFRRMMVAAVLARAGLRDSARAVVMRTEEERGERPPARAAEAYARVLVGDREGAMRILREKVAVEPHSRDWVARMPWYRPLWQEPAFRRLTREPSPLPADSPAP